MSMIRKNTYKRRAYARRNLPAISAAQNRMNRLVAIQAARMLANTRTSGYNTIEFKFKDTDIGSANVASTGAIISTLNEVDQGTGVSGRNGRKISITKLDIQLELSLASSSNATLSAVSNSDVIRIIVYLDKQANAATAANTDILATADYNSFRNLENKERFRVLADQYASLRSDVSHDGTNYFSGKFFSERIHISKKFKKAISIEYKGTGNGIADITSNNIGILYITENGALTVIGNSRIRYVDN